MSWLSAIVTDLREKRLWPVVAILIAGTVALPLLIPHDVKGPVPGAPGGGAPANKIVTPGVRRLIDASVPTANAKHVIGKLRDPFALPNTPAPAAAGKAALGPAKTPTTAPHTTPKPVATRLGTVYAVVLRFGQAADVRRISAPIRLAPLPDATSPQAAYLGVKDGGRQSLFLLAPGIIASGDGACAPSASDCQILSLRAGDTEFLDVKSPTSGLVQYELDLLSITAHHTQTRAAAISVNRLVSAAGQAFARRVNSSEAGKLAFDLVRGVIVTVPAVSKGGVTPGQSTLRATGGAPLTGFGGAPVAPPRRRSPGSPPRRRPRAPTPRPGAPTRTPVVTGSTRA